jgi:hypothetical protein
MAFVSANGDKRGEYQLDQASYPDVKTENVTVGGAEGIKQSGTFKAAPDAVGPGPADDEKTVVYIFYTNNRTYRASYNVNSTYPDVLNNFNILVTKTFKF